MRIAVITPYCNESRETLSRCIESVANQTVECRHYLIADLPALIFSDESESVYRHICLGESHKDYGNTPRSVGALLAVSEGADAVCFLDADNSYDPDHVASCLAAAQGHDYIVARRRIVLPDGSPVNCQDEPVSQHVDTSCFFLLPGAFHTLAYWALQPKPLTILGDRLFLALLQKERLKFAVVDHPTVVYTSNWRVHWEAAGKTPPSDAKKTVDTSEIGPWWQHLSAAERQH